MSMNRRFQLFSMAAGLFAAGAARASAGSGGGFKVVYHISDGIAQATRAMGNIRNHLAAEPGTKIVVVTHGAGIDFLLDGAESAPGLPFTGAIGSLASAGVEFRVCNNTLVARKISPDRVAMEAKIVPSGVAEVAKLQASEGFVYLKP